MPLLDTVGWKFKPELPYLTVGESGMFKRLREAGALSSFRIVRCEECGADVPKGKRFCSKQCFQKWQAKQEEDHGS